MNFNHYLPDTEQRIERLRNLIAGRTLMILLPGPSIKELSTYMPTLNKLDLCYATVNDYWVMEELYHPIDIVLRSAIECDVPCMRDYAFLTRPQPNMLISEQAGYHERNMPLAMFCQQYYDRLLWFVADRTQFALTRPNPQFPLHFLAQASFSILICLGIIGKAKQIILFGAEGVKDDKDIGAVGGWTLGDPMELRKRRLIYDTNLYRQTMKGILRNVCDTYSTWGIPILNCSPYSHYGIHPAISYEKMLEVVSA